MCILCELADILEERERQGFGIEHNKQLTPGTLLKTGLANTVAAIRNTKPGPERRKIYLDSLAYLVAEAITLDGSYETQHRKTLSYDPTTVVN